MTVINLRTADGFTLYDNFYAIPADMPVEDAVEIVQSVADNAETWEFLDAELAEHGIAPLYGPNAPTVDIDL